MACLLPRLTTTGDRRQGSPESSSGGRAARCRRDSDRTGACRSRADYTIELANSGGKPAEVAVFENAPVNTVEAIRVEVEDGATPYEELDGWKLRWLVKLGPGDRESVELPYSAEIAKHYRY